MMIQRYILLASIEIFCLVGYAPAQEPDRVQVPSTRISIIPPPCYSLMGSSSIFYCTSNPAVLTIVETATSVHDAGSSYSDSDNLASLDFEAVSRPEKLTIDGVDVIRFNLRKRMGLLDEHSMIYRVFVGGDSLGSFTAIVNYVDTVSISSVEPLVKSIETIRWDRGRSLTPMELLGFSMNVGSQFKMVKGGSRWSYYSTDGKESPPDRPFPAIYIRLFDRPPLEIEQTQYKQLMEKLIDQARPDIKVSKVILFGKISVDGISGWETVSSATWLPRRSSVMLYCTLLFHPNSFIEILGFADETHPDEQISGFKDMVRSIKRNFSTIDDSSACGAALNSRKFTEAQSCFEAELDQNPASLSARLGRAEALSAQAKYDPAIRDFDLVIAREKFNDRALLGRARALKGKKNLSDALKDMAVVVELNSQNLDLLLERAEMRKANLEERGASRDYERAIALAPDSGSLYAMLSDLQPEDLAIETLSKAISLDPRCGIAYKRRGKIFFYRNDRPAALLDFNAAARYLPSDEKLYSLRGTIYYDDDQMTLALQDFGRGEKSNPGFMAYRALVKGLLKKKDESLDDFSVAIRLDSTKWETYFERGVILYLNGDFKNAQADFRKAAAKTSTGEVRTWLFLSEYKQRGWTVATKNLRLYYEKSTGMHEDWGHIVRYFLDEIPEAELVRLITPVESSSSRRSEKERLAEAMSDTYFAIGLRHFATGEKTGAKKYWSKCLETKAFGIVSYDVARSFLREEWEH